MSRTFWFEGGTDGQWNVASMTTLRGEPLDPVTHVKVTQSDSTRIHQIAWRLAGITSNLRYTDGAELATLRARQPDLGRPAATHAALIPIKKTAAWWDMPQDERLAIFSRDSRHTAIGLDYLPQIARRLHHCRDLGGPFDFLTWFEYEPSHEQMFDELLQRLRDTAEWRYVEREVDIRLRASVWAGDAIAGG